MSPYLDGWTDLKDVMLTVFGGAGVIVTGALAMWVRQSKASLSVSKNDLNKTENSSQGAWIAQLEARLKESLERENRLREQCDACLHNDATHRATIGAMKMQIDRMGRELTRLRRLVVAMRPELSDLIESENGGLDELPPEN